MDDVLQKSVKADLYEIGVTFSDIASEAGVHPRLVTYAVKKWGGSCGNPKGKTRQVLQLIENYIGRPVYEEK